MGISTKSSADWLSSCRLRGHARRFSTRARVRPEFKALLEIAIRADVFSSNWEHCDRIASYVARMVSHNRTNSLLYLNLFSSALNELLETAFRSIGATARSPARSCAPGRSTGSSSPSRPMPTVADLLSRCGRDRFSGRTPPRAIWRRSFAEGPVDRRIGLLELAVDYRAKFSLGEAGRRASASSPISRSTKPDRTEEADARNVLHGPL